MSIIDCCVIALYDLSATQPPPLKLVTILDSCVTTYLSLCHGILYDNAYLIKGTKCLHLYVADNEDLALQTHEVHKHSVVLVVISVDTDDRTMQLVCIIFSRLCNHSVYSYILPSERYSEKNFRVDPSIIYTVQFAFMNNVGTTSPASPHDLRDVTSTKMSRYYSPYIGTDQSEVMRRGCNLT